MKKKKIINSGSPRFVALDIGTTKMCVLIAEQDEEQGLRIIGIGKSPSHGVSRGVVVDIALAVEAIKKAIREAELMAGCMVESVYVGISGSHIAAMNSHGMIPIPNGSVTAYDITQVLAAAKAIIVPEGQQILHVLPQFYVIDGQQKVQDPTGMFGVRLEVQVHIVTGSVASVQNIIRCCELAGVFVEDVILEPLASADAVLSEDERQLGVGILDIGGGTSDFAIYQQGVIRHTNVVAIAGNHVTNDIALCLRTTIKCAETVKKKCGSVSALLIDGADTCDIEMVHGGEYRTVSLKTLTSIIEPRIQELLYIVQDDIVKHHVEPLMQAGLVLTGGGALLPGFKELAQAILQVPVRVGKPHVPQLFKEMLENPMYATGYGMLVYALNKKRSASVDQSGGPMVNRILWRMKSWVSDFF
jgi:cell division protein FtsA